MRKMGNQILDMTATPSFHTASSKSYILSRQSQGLCSNRQLGWIDVHYPCDGHIKTQIRVHIPKEYHEPDKMKAMIQAILVLAGIPEDETWETAFIDASNVTVMAQTTNRDGITDRI